MKMILSELCFSMGGLLQGQNTSHVCHVLDRCDFLILIDFSDRIWEAEKHVVICQCFVMKSIVELPSPCRDTSAGSPPGSWQSSEGFSLNQ